ncbi:efflux RND transporter periplasmic adaptor subunit [Thiomicrorhabdus sp. Milos-T2]|uniref:efflux RND transporter periplasmic adaptor subunit n=1 Tax=Thiomicrorhabdus sp. Milos-T2 TaxID=90814 RepID=UPI00068BF851|nr:efflux RND transporter periplasmic adaptor subunit [Thiomicrorhabdus sp. Milos-T2]
MKLLQLNLRSFFLLLTLPSILSPVFAAKTEEIHVETVRSAVYDSKVNLGGTVIPFKEVTLTAQMPGQVNYISGIEGDIFKAGTLIISINDDALRAQRKAAMAQWNQAAYAYQNAQSQYNRELWSPKSEQSMPGMALPNLMDQVFTRPMGNSMGVGDREVEKRADLTNAMSMVKKAQAQMAQIKAQIDEIDVRLNDTKSTAPFDGVIVKKMVEAGDTVQPGQPLLVFAKSNHLSIELNIPVNLMQGIKKGQQLTARIANSTPIQVRVAQVFPVANGQQHTVKVKMDLPLGAPAAPGMYAQVAVHNSTSQNQAFPVIPSQAIIQRGSLPSVFVFNPKTNQVSMKIVRVSKSSNNGYKTVLSGIKEGEQIVINPPASISSGWILKNGRLMPPSEAQNITEDKDA